MRLCQGRGGLGACRPAGCCRFRTAGAEWGRPVIIGRCAARCRDHRPSLPSIDRNCGRVDWTCSLGVGEAGDPQTTGIVERRAVMLADGSLVASIPIRPSSMIWRQTAARYSSFDGRLVLRGHTIMPAPSWSRRAKRGFGRWAARGKDRRSGNAVTRIIRMERCPLPVLLEPKPRSICRRFSCLKSMR